MIMEFLECHEMNAFALSTKRVWSRVQNDEYFHTLQTKAYLRFFAKNFTSLPFETNGLLQSTREESDRYALMSGNNLPAAEKNCANPLWAAQEEEMLSEDSEMMTSEKLNLSSPTNYNN